MNEIKDWLNKNKFPNISDDLVFALKYQAIIMSLYEMMYPPITTQTQSKQKGKS